MAEHDDGADVHARPDRRNRFLVPVLVGVIVVLGLALLAVTLSGDGSDADVSGSDTSVGTEAPAPSVSDAVADGTTTSDGTSARPVDDTLGAYPGFGDEATMRELEATLGVDMGAVVQFGDRRSADDMVFSSQGALSQLQPWIEDHTPTYSLAVPLAFGDADARGDDGGAAVVENLRATAAGAYDEQYRRVADRLLASDLADAVVRIGHEFDGDWFPWSARPSCEAYIEAFRHVAQLFREESADFRIDWSGDVRHFDDYGPCAYPGDDVVDVIGLDVYDQTVDTDAFDGSGWIDPVAVWDEQFLPRLQRHLDFAVSKGKPVSYPEWGLRLSHDSAAFGGDNPYFITSMAEWFDDLPDTGPGSLEYQAYFFGVEEFDVRLAPDSWAAYQEEFGAP